MTDDEQQSLLRMNPFFWLRFRYENFSKVMDEKTKNEAQNLAPSAPSSPSPRE